MARGPVMAPAKASESTAAHGLKVRNVNNYSSKVTLEISLICLSFSFLLVTVMVLNSWAWVGPDSGRTAGRSKPDASCLTAYVSGGEHRQVPKGVCLFRFFLRKF